FRLSYLSSCSPAQPDLHSFPARRSSVLVTDFVTVGSAAPIGGGLTIRGVEGQPLTNVTLATFTNPGNPGAPASEFSATVNWGDGTLTSTRLTSTHVNSAYTVTCMHTNKK